MFQTSIEENLQSAIMGPNDIGNDRVSMQIRIRMDLPVVSFCVP